MLAAAFGAGANTTFVVAVQTLRLIVMVLLAPLVGCGSMLRPCTPHQATCSAPRTGLPESSASWIARVGHGSGPGAAPCQLVLAGSKEDLVAGRGWGLDRGRSRRWQRPEPLGDVDVLAEGMRVPTRSGRRA